MGIERKNHMKHRRLLAGMLALCCCAAPLTPTALPLGTTLTAFAEEVQTSGDYQYFENKDGTVTLYKYQGQAARVVIPEVIKGKPVSTLNAFMFYGNAGVQEVTVPDSVTTIGEGCFNGCSALASVKLPGALTAIQSNTFADCPKLNNIIVPESVTQLGYAAFEGCSSLDTISLPGSIAYIEGSAFNGTGFRKLTLPEGIKSIGIAVFNNMPNLTEITIPDSVTNIALNNFFNTALPAAENGVIYAGNWVVGYNDNGAEELTIREGTVGISEEALSNKSFMKVTLPEGLKYINKSALMYNSRLQEINFPESLVKVTGSVFGTKGFSGAAGFLSSDEEFVTIGGWLMAYNGASTDIVVPEGVTGIYSEAFHGKKPASVTLPDGLTYIGDNAFSYSNMKEVTIPDTVTHIGSSAFAYSTVLETVQLPAALTEIPDGMFLSCGKLRQVSIPENITVIGEEAFSGCDALTEIMIPDSVTEIGKSCFHNCTNAAEIYISKNLTAIPYGAFSNCILLEEIVIPEGVTSIGDEALRGCSAVKYLSLPESLAAVSTTVGISGPSIYKPNDPSYILFHNPDCVIEDSRDTIPSGMAICGAAGSTAEAYASKYERTFIPIENAPAPAMKGDVTCDGKLSIADAVILARVVAEDTSVKVTSRGLKNGELDGNTDLNMTDVTCLITMIVTGNNPEIKTAVPEDAEEEAAVTVPAQTETVPASETTTGTETYAYTGYEQFTTTSYIAYTTTSSAAYSTTNTDTYAYTGYEQFTTTAYADFTGTYYETGTYPVAYTGEYTETFTSQPTGTYVYETDDSAFVTETFTTAETYTGNAEYTDNAHETTTYIVTGTKPGIISLPEGTVQYDLIPDGLDTTFNGVNHELMVYPGEAIKVNWIVTNDPGTAGMQMHFDFSSLTFVKRTAGKAYKAPTEWNDQEFIYVFGGDKEMTAEDGAVISSFYFKVPEEPGTYTLTLRNDKENIVRPLLEEDPDIPFVFYGLTVIVSSPCD